MSKIDELTGRFDQTPPPSAQANAFGVFTATATVPATGNQNIDALLAGTKWASTSLTFSFTDSITDYESGYPDRASHGASFQTLNATQRAVVRKWLGTGGEYYNVSNLAPSELTGTSDRNATIRLAMSNVPGTAFAYYPGNTVQAGDAWFNKADYNNPVIGNYAYITFGHELGHALGLKHGHETGGVSNVATTADRDSMEFSIMTYRSYVGASTTGGYTNETWGFAQSLMMYDIRAIQQMYGAWFGYNATDTTYTFSTTTGQMSVNGVGQGLPGANRIFRTVWDGNGVDTYDFSNYTTNLSVDLTPGGWSDLNVGGNFQRAQLGSGRYARGHVFNALQYNGDTRSLIENGKGGSGNDVIRGNAAYNGLYGNAGNDTIYGGDGNDTVDGGNGTDLIYLGNGNDYVNVTSLGDDTFYGEAGNDYIYGYTGNETYYGGDGNDTLLGSSGNDLINGGAGDDSMDGGSGTDTVDYIYWNGGGTYNLATGLATFTGLYTEEILNFENISTGDGNDTVTGSAVANRIVTNGGNDTIYGGDGNDTVDGGNGNDLIYLGNGDDSVNISSLGDDTFYGGAGNDYIYGYTGNETYYGEDGNDTLLGFSGNDSIYGGIGLDTIYGGDGNDTVDGGDGDDLIYLGNGDDSLNVSSLGNDTFYGEAGNDYIYGYTGNETYYGGDGNDTLLGFSGNDIMNGGAGKDSLTGGVGVDTFEYTTLTDSLLATYDVITDYVLGDKINAPGNVVATTLAAASGNASSLSAAAISSVLSSGVFTANSARAFRVTGFSGTFIAMNNAVAGFNAATDSIIFLQNYTLGSVGIV